MAQLGTVLFCVESPQRLLYNPFMARQARQYGESDTYHVMLRGINPQNIFEEGEDFTMFLGMLADVKELSGVVRRV